MKRVLAYLVLAVLLLSLFSCTSQQAGDTDTPIIPPGGISINRPDTNVMYTENFAVTDKMVAYSLRELYTSFCDNLAEMKLSAADLGIVAGKFLGEQTCLVDTSVKTWLEYFATQVEYSFMEQLVLCEAAKNEGLTLDDSDAAAIDATLEELYETAHRKGKTENAYIAELYGSDVTAGDIRDALELSHLAEKYLRHAADSTDTSEEAVKRFYSQHADSIDTVDFLIYVFAAGEEEYADALAEQTSAEDFLEYTHYHATTVRGLTEEDYEEIKAGHILCENIHMDKDDETVSFAFSASAGDVRVTKDKSGAVTVVRVTRQRSRNENTDENGVPMWIAEASAMMEGEVVDAVTEKAASAHPVTVDRQKLYAIDIKG